MITTEHFDAFLQSMNDGDVDGASAHVAETLAFRSPGLSAALEGKSEVANMLGELLHAVTPFAPRFLLRDQTDVVAVWTIDLAHQDVDVFGHIHLDKHGLIDSMMVAWRRPPVARLVIEHDNGGDREIPAPFAELIAGNGQNGPDGRPQLGYKHH